MNSTAVFRFLSATALLVSGICVTSCNLGHNEKTVELYDARPVYKIPTYAIGVPVDPPLLLPGEAQPVLLVLIRPWGNTQDVQLRFESADAIEIVPAQMVVRACDKSDTVVVLKAGNKASTGEFIITVLGSMPNAPDTRAQFRVQVLAGNPVAVCRLNPCVTKQPPS